MLERLSHELGNDPVRLLLLKSMLRNVFKAPQLAGMVPAGCTTTAEATSCCLPPTSGSVNAKLRLMRPAVKVMDAILPKGLSRVFIEQTVEN